VHIWEQIYPLTDKQRKARQKPERWERVMELFERGDAPNLAPSHTLWGAYNAVTRYEDYRQAKEAGPDRRLNRVWFGRGADLKLRGIERCGCAPAAMDELAVVYIQASHGDCARLLRTNQVLLPACLKSCCLWAAK
jgi:Domain of unknown function (DUF932)